MAELLHPQKSDAEIFSRLRKGDRDVLGKVYKDNYAGLFQFAYTYVYSEDLAAEIVQNVFVRVMTNQSSLPVEGSVRGYLYGAVRNHSLNALRSDRRAEKAQNRYKSEIHISEIPGDDPVIKAELTEVVTRSIKALPERQQRAILLRFNAQLSYPEIANALGISADAARMLVNRGTEELKNSLKPYLAQDDNIF